MNIATLSPELQRNPIGILPKTTYDMLRARYILDAMLRYAKAGKPVPVAWVLELTSLYPHKRV